MKPASVQPSVWVVDDIALDAERARAALAHDYLVRVFSDGADAIEALDAVHKPSVIVLDWLMPGISGVDVCRFLRSHVLGNQHIAILLLTARRQTEQVVEGLRAGANDFLSKPYADEELIARVDALVRSQELLARAERAEAENRVLLENMPDPLLVVQGDDRISFANDAAATLFFDRGASLVGCALREVAPELEATVKGGRIAAPPAQPDVVVAGRIFSPSARQLASDGRLVVVLRDVTERARHGHPDSASPAPPRG